MKKSKHCVAITIIFLCFLIQLNSCGSDSSSNNPNPSVNCGNSQLDTGEECDDGNSTNGDGCESSCTVTLNFCGNGILENEELCDDGNDTDGDGCESDCSISQKTVIYEEIQMALDIEDNTEFGYECANFDVPNDDFNTLLKVEVALGIDHPFLGDLKIRLDSAKDSYIYMYEISDASANLASDSEIRFTDDAQAKAEDMGSSLEEDETVCKDDGICNYLPSPPPIDDNNYFGKLTLSDFIGENTVGKWSICVGDRQVNNVGTLESVRLTLVKQFNQAYCGNGILEPEEGEECDDGNDVNDDGCEYNCEITMY